MTLRELMDAWEKGCTVLMIDAEGALYVGTPEVLHMLPDRRVAVVLRVRHSHSGEHDHKQIIYAF
jgi:hypothetical protein